MEREYWIEKWQKDNDFSIENDRLREKSFIFASFPKANMFGFQSLGFRHLIYADAYARYQRFQNKNVLFPVGIHSLCNTSFLENKKHRIQIAELACANMVATAAPLTPI